MIMNFNCIGHENIILVEWIKHNNNNIIKEKIVMNDNEILSITII